MWWKSVPWPQLRWVGPHRVPVPYPAWLLLHMSHCAAGHEICFSWQRKCSRRVRHFLIFSQPSYCAHSFVDTSQFGSKRCFVKTDSLKYRECSIKIKKLKGVTKHCECSIKIKGGDKWQGVLICLALGKYCLAVLIFLPISLCLPGKFFHPPSFTLSPSGFTKGRLAFLSRNVAKDFFFFFFLVFLYMYFKNDASHACDTEKTTWALDKTDFTSYTSFLNICWSI